MDNEIQNLKTNEDNLKSKASISQQNDYKNAELCRSEDRKNPELKGDVGKHLKTYNICLNTAEGTSQRVAQEEALAKVSALELEISAAMPTNNEIPVKDASSQSKISQAKKTVCHANQKGKKRKVKIVEATHFVSDSDSNFKSLHHVPDILSPNLISHSVPTHPSLHPHFCDLYLLNIGILDSPTLCTIQQLGLTTAL
ncbi:hypothetical protein MTR67_019093 [Solanum verrucosum]|uniref:Uncharacterized protein n=1 Tax=Solanum verrucosum TaxID=315347 RepID=A0AAF0QM91_SOLVR|nr:hypothetical protein MTR67_019093 [Solanum verrucosum]